jgi:hypothetical protein
VVFAGHRYKYHRNYLVILVIIGDRLIVSIDRRDSSGADTAPQTPNVRAAARRRATDDERRVRVVTDARSFAENSGRAHPRLHRREKPASYDLLKLAR